MLIRVCCLLASVIAAHPIAEVVGGSRAARFFIKFEQLPISDLAGTERGEKTAVSSVTATLSVAEDGAVAERSATMLVYPDANGIAVTDGAVGEQQTACNNLYAGI